MIRNKVAIILIIIISTIILIAYLYLMFFLENKNEYNTTHHKDEGGVEVKLGEGKEKTSGSGVTNSKTGALFKK